MELVFVIPDPKVFPSGGNLYNAQLVTALLEIGVDTQIIDFKEFEKESRSVLTCKSYFVDTLYLKEIEDYLKCNTNVEEIYLLIHHLQSMDLLAEEQANYFRTKELPILEKLSGCLVTSFYTQGYLKHYNYISKKILVVPPAFEKMDIEACLRSPFKGERRENKHHVQAILISNLIERKGILPFLKALQKHKELPRHLKIKIIGSNILEPKYAAKCQEVISLLSNTVSFLGEQSHQATLEHLSQSNLFISCASMETFGMALQEAVGFGIPILAVNGGNVAMHISKRENGFLFDEPALLVQFLIRMCNESVLLENLQIGAKEKIQKEDYTWKMAARNLEKML